MIRADIRPGGVAEWSNALVLKTSRGLAPLVGSNPTPTVGKCPESQANASASADAGDDPQPVDPESLAHPLRAAAPDADLAELAERWPELPEAIRTGIMAMVRAVAR